MNKTKLNILVTTVGGMTSPDILKAYKNLEKYEINIVGTDAFEFAVGRKFVDTFEVSPNSASDEISFVEYIETLVQKHSIDIVVPCGNEDNLALAKYRDKISCKIMVGNYDDLIKAYDKGMVYEQLQKSLPQNAPKYFIVNSYDKFIEATKKLDFPNKKIVLKPRFGRGGRGVYILTNNFDYDTLFKSKPTSEHPFELFDKLLKKEQNFDDLIVMEYLNEPFYSIYSLCKNGENIFTLTHTREWGNASQTFRGKVYYDENIEKIASNIIEKFNLSYTNNMELATTEDGRLVLFDLNPRIGASSGIDKDIGFNFPLEALKLVLEEDIKIDKNSFKDSNIFLRYFDQTWIDK